MAEADKSGSIRIKPGQQQSAFIGFGTAVAEKTLAKVSRCQSSDPFGKINKGLGKINGCCVLQGVYLSAGPCGYFRVAVPGINYGDP
jgi:hypothetical protein